MLPPHDELRAFICTFQVLLHEQLPVSSNRRDTACIHGNQETHTRKSGTLSLPGCVWIFCCKVLFSADVSGPAKSLASWHLVSMTYK